jgi:hypothetical protein
MGLGSAPPFTISSPGSDFPLQYLVVGMELPVATGDQIKFGWRIIP